MRTPVGDQVGEQLSGLGQGGPPGRGVVLAAAGQQRRLPEHDVGAAPRRAVVVDRLQVDADQPAARLRRVGRGRRGQDEHRVGAVPGGQPPQPPQHGGDVRAEHPPVVVTLVDHDVAQAAQEGLPPGVPGQQRMMQQVRVGQHQARVVADPAPFLRRGVAVVGRGPDAVEPAGRRSPAADRRPGPWSAPGTGRWRRDRCGCRAPSRTAVEHRQQVAQRLAGRRPGGDHHVPARPGCARPRRPGAATGRSTPDRARAATSSGSAQAGQGRSLPVTGRDRLHVTGALPAAGCAQQPCR